MEKLHTNTPPQKKKRLLATTAAAVARNQFFDATTHVSSSLSSQDIDKSKDMSEPVPRVRIVKKTSWGGEATISGCISQSHALYIESIFFEAVDCDSDEFGVMRVLFDKHKVRQKMAKSADRCPADWLTRIENDLIGTTVNSKIDGKPVLNGALFYKFERSDCHVANRMHTANTASTAKHQQLAESENRSLWIATISAEFMRLIESDIKRFYDPAVFKQFKTGVGQAVARLLLTHDKRESPNGGWKVDKLLEGVGVIDEKTAKPTIRKNRFKLRNEKDAFKQIGFDLSDDNRITRTPS